MELKEHYTVAEVIEIVNTLSNEDKKMVEKELQKNTFDAKKILEIINPIHQKYNETYQALA